MAFIADNWLYFLIGIVLVPLLVKTYPNLPNRKLWWETKDWNEPLTPSELRDLERAREREAKQKSKEVDRDSDEKN